MSSFYNKLNIPFLLWTHNIILEQIIVLFSHVSCISWQAAQEAHKAVETPVRLYIVISVLPQGLQAPARAVQHCSIGGTDTGLC